MTLYILRTLETYYMVYVANRGLGPVISQRNYFSTPDEVIEHIRCLLPADYEFDFEGNRRKIRALALMQSHLIDFEEKLAYKIAGIARKLN